MSAPVNANTDHFGSKQQLFCKSNNLYNILLFSSSDNGENDQKSHFTPLLIDDGICYGCILKSMKKESQNKEQLQLKQTYIYYLL